EARDRRPGGGFRLRRSGAHANGTRGGGRRYTPSLVNKRSAGGWVVRARCGGVVGRGAGERADPGGPGGQGDRGGIPQPSDFGDGSRAQAAYFSGGGHGNAAGRAGPRRRAESGGGDGSSGEPG